MSLPGDRLFWSEADVVQATEDFDQSHRISEGTFADIYQGQRNGVAFAFKKLREVRRGCLQGAVRPGTEVGCVFRGCVFFHRWPAPVQGPWTDSYRQRCSSASGKLPVPSPWPNDDGRQCFLCARQGLALPLLFWAIFCGCHGVSRRGQFLKHKFVYFVILEAGKSEGIH